MWERFKLTGLRTIAWYIDAFAVAAVVMPPFWFANVVGFYLVSPENEYAAQLIAFVVILFVYRLVVEYKWASSLGKFSLKLEVIHARQSRAQVAIRNSYILLGALGAVATTPLHYAGEFTLIVVGLTTLLLGRSLFDFLAGAFVEPAMQNGQHNNPWKKDA